MIFKNQDANFDGSLSLKDFKAISAMLKNYVIE